MTWQDWLSIVSSVIGIVSFILTIWTLIRTGKIQKAVETKANEVQSMNKLKGSTDRFMEVIISFDSKDFKAIGLDDYRKLLSVVEEVMLCKFALTDEEINILEEIKEFCIPIYKNNSITEEKQREFMLYMDKLKLILTRSNIK